MGHYKVKHLDHPRAVWPLVQCEFPECNWDTKYRTNYAIHLLKAHNQHEFVIIPPQPGIDIAELAIISPQGVSRAMQESYRVAQMGTTTVQESNTLSEVADTEDRSSKMANLDPRLRFSLDSHSLPIRGIACERLTSL